MKIFLFLINSIYWLWAFAVPVIICGIPAWWLYERSSRHWPWSLLLALAGIIMGIWVAERIRKREGLSSFFSRLSETPDIEDRGKR